MPRSRAAEPTTPTSDAERIVELETELRQRDEKIKELRDELTEATELVDNMREQVEDADRLIGQWIEVFEMQQDEHGRWLWDPAQTKLWEEHKTLRGRWEKLLREWNKFVPEYNARVAPREMGRRIAASAAQQADVLKRRKAKQSLRAIAAATGLSLQTVRTITEKTTGKGRAGKRTNELRRREFDRLRAAAYRARKKSREALPAQIAEVQETGAALVKQAKGLGRRQ